jgi:hypothetical protein
MSTFLLKALDAVASGSTKPATTARFVLNNSPIGSISHEPAFIYHILEAFTIANINRMEAKSNGEEYIDTKPESMLILLRRVMDKACWNARKQLIAQQIAEEGERENGIDYSQETAEETGVYTESKNIPDIITEDYRTMIATHAILTERMSYLEDLDPSIPMFVQTQYCETAGEWLTVTECGNWDDSLETMNSIARELTTPKGITQDLVDEVQKRLSA